MLKQQYEAEIQQLLSQMTIEEKAGQLNQCGPSLAGAFDVDFEELLNMVCDGRVSKEKFQKMMASAEQDYHEEALRAGHIGSYNGVSDAETANRLQRIAVEETRLGIPLLFGYDVIHGYRTVTPIPLAESCAWDERLWEETARMSAKEATAGGVHMTFAPMVDVSRDPRWGRISEGAGEDVLINSLYGRAKVKGFQGEDLTRADAMAACVKHFAAYGAVEAGRDYNRVDMSGQKLYEEYLPPFEACVKAGARAVMPAFNDINGVPCTVNEKLLRDILRKQWGFDGMTISDANAIAECVNHGCAADNADAARQALLAGVDMDMTSGVYSRHLKDLIDKGQLNEQELDRAAANVLRIKFELGLFDNPYQASKEREKREMLTGKHRELARTAAEKSIVLLKNEGVLPFSRKQKIGIVGELAAQAGEMTGTWALRAVESDCVSIIDACESQNIDYVYSPGKDEREFREMAKTCDVFLAAVGEYKRESGEASSRGEIALKADDMKMLETLQRLGKPAAAVIFSGRPLAIPWLSENIPAILEAWHPGVEAGNAILNIVFGEVNPSAKLTAAFPYSSGQCPLYYAHINTGRPAGKSKFTSKYLDIPTEPVYPFGYGLSYTTYEYKNLDIQEKGSFIQISVRVKNTGKRRGEEIVQCYVHDTVAKRARPVKQLAGFQKTSLQPGEEKTITFEIEKDKLGYYDEKMQYLVEEGVFEFFVGGNSRDCLMEKIEITE